MGQTNRDGVVHLGQNQLEQDGVLHRLLDTVFCNEQIQHPGKRRLPFVKNHQLIRLKRKNRTAKLLAELTRPFEVAAAFVQKVVVNLLLGRLQTVLSGGLFSKRGQHLHVLVSVVEQEQMTRCSAGTGLCFAVAQQQHPRQKPQEQGQKLAEG